MAYFKFVLQTEDYLGYSIGETLEKAFPEGLPSEWKGHEDKIEKIDITTESEKHLAEKAFTDELSNHQAGDFELSNLALTSVVLFGDFTLALKEINKLKEGE